MVAASLFHCLQLILYPWFFRKVGDAQGGQKLDMSKGEETVTAVKETTVGTETKSGLESMTCPRTSRDRFRSRCKSPVRSICLQGLLPCPVAELALDHSPSPPLPLLFLLSSTCHPRMIRATDCRNAILARSGMEALEGVSSSSWCFSA